MACPETPQVTNAFREITTANELAEVFTNHPTLYYFKDGNVILNCSWMLCSTLLSKHSCQGMLLVAEARVGPRSFSVSIFIVLHDDGDGVENYLTLLYCMTYHDMLGL